MAQYSERSDRKKPPHTLIHTYKPLIVCGDGGVTSQRGTLARSITVSLLQSHVFQSDWFSLNWDFTLTS